MSLKLTARDMARASFAVATVISAATAQAHTTQWYSDHLDVAQVTEDACLKRLKADEQLNKADMDECQRAGSAVARGGKYTPSPPKSW